MCCLIYHSPTATPFTREEFDDIYARNRAGFGVIWRWPSGKVSYEKGLWSPDRIWSTYQALYDHGCRELVLHWRLATSGAKDYHNVHPFETRHGVLVAHNGVLRHRSTKTESDTRCFISDVLEPALAAGGGHRAPADPVWRSWLARRVGQGNRLVLWQRKAKSPWLIEGDRAPVVYRGRWYANTYSWSAPFNLEEE